MPNSNLSKPFAWAALIHGFQPEGRDIATQLGEAVAFLVDEPTLEIITHDAEAERWEGAREWLELVVDDFATALDERLADRDRTEALEVLAELNAVKPDRDLRFEVQLAKNGRYAIGTCEVGKCGYFASGTVPQVEAAMSEHVTGEHATKATADIVTTLDEPELTKPRCDEHGVFARESDGKCRRCDEVPTPTAADFLPRVLEALKLSQPGHPLHENAGQMLAAALAKSAAAPKVEPEPTPEPEPATRITQEVAPSAPARMILGVRDGSGLLARRSTHELAPYLPVSQRELSQMKADEVRPLVIAAGIDADWVPAKDL